MVRKAKSPSTKPKALRKPRSRRKPAPEPGPLPWEKLIELYPSLAQGPTPAEQRAEIEKRLRERGIGPIEDYDRYLEEVSDFWPADETCDEFLAWLRTLRREGRP